MCKVLSLMFVDDSYSISLHVPSSLSFPALSITTPASLTSLMSLKICAFSSLYSLPKFRSSKSLPWIYWNSPPATILMSFHTLTVGPHCSQDKVKAPVWPVPLTWPFATQLPCCCCHTLTLSPSIFLYICLCSFYNWHFCKHTVIVH